MSSLPNIEVRSEPSIQAFIQARYESTKQKASSLYGKVLLGIRSDGQKEICKISNKDRLEKLHLLEDPFMEIHVMRHLHDCEGHVELIDALQDETELLMILEYMEGGDLHDYLCKHHQHGLGVDRALDIGQQLCSALLSMHERGFCHLDVSLENILIDPQTDQVKLCDYGLSRRFTESRRFPPNRISSGKRGYISYEMASRREFNGELADVWGVAVTVWILMTGHPPFPAASKTNVYFTTLFNRDCSILLGKCGISSFIPERERLFFNSIFVSEDRRANMTQCLRMLDDHDSSSESDVDDDDDESTE